MSQSRIGKLPINVPTDVTIKWNQSNIEVSGKFGELKKKIPDTIFIDQKKNQLYISVEKLNRQSRSLHGLYRSIINNMIIGVSKKFVYTLNLIGIGYRAAVQQQTLVLNLGYSHPVELKIPEEISIEIIQSTTIKLTGCNKETLGLFAATIRSCRPPEPYKGKGIRYSNEIIKRKAGKSGKK